MRGLFAAAVAIASIAALTPAHAESYYEPQPPRPRDPWSAARFEGAVGALVGGQRIGHIDGTGGGFHLDAGVRLDRLYLYGEYDFLSVGQDGYDTPNPVRGFMHRVGGNVRYSLAAFGGGSAPVRGDVWGEIGAGHEQIQWHEGGRLGRRDLAFGLGAQATFRVGRDRPRYVGVYYAVKGWVATSPERKDGAPTCAGPCDEATRPSPHDFGIFFNFGVPFGR
jgi:hypothetical protein